MRALLLAFAGEQAIAEQGAEGALLQVGLRVVRDIVEEDALEASRVVDQPSAAERRDLFPDRLLEGRKRDALEGIVTWPSAKEEARALWRRPRADHDWGVSDIDGRHGEPPAQLGNPNTVQPPAPLNAVHARRARRRVQGRSIRLISQSSVTPVLRATSSRTASPRPSRSAAVAVPELIMKLACSGENIATPNGLPRQPAASISFQALCWGGFLNVEPPVFSRIGWLDSRRWVISSMVAWITAGSSGRPWKTAPNQITEFSATALWR